MSLIPRTSGQPWSVVVHGDAQGRSLERLIYGSSERMLTLALGTQSSLFPRMDIPVLGT